ncbi:hypothetical protein GQ53DRAFT_815237 [Thozetella sp. PMI_491]|nr:hypothetical protein GQ53DRAFT_815237 [Thozetella sp. PMI_491]
MSTEDPSFRSDERKASLKLSNLTARLEGGNDELFGSLSPTLSQSAQGGRRVADTDLLASVLEHVRIQDARIANLEGDRKTDIDVGPRADFRTETSEEIDERGSSLVLGQKYIVPEVRKCNIKSFKNRFSVDEARYAVDVLESTYLLDQEIQDELRIRQSRPRVRAKDHAKEPKAKTKAPANFVDQAIHTDQSDAKWISRIRVQSPAILAILARIMSESWNGQPRTFFRPFSPLIYFHHDVKDVLRDLEAKWSDTENSTTVGAPGSHVDDPTMPEAVFPVDDSPSALAELRCYVRFIEDEVLPLYHKFDHLDDRSERKVVRFHDLWYLFRAGELVYQPIISGSNKENHNVAISQRPWRAYGTKPFCPKYRITPADHRKYLHIEEAEENDSFTILCYYIDYTGDEFCVVTDKFEIQPFEGERPITSLVVYPWRFVPSHEETLKRSIEDGRKVLHYLHTRHGAYDWWTMTRDPRGEPAIDVDGNILKRPEHVNSEVIVDFVEAFQTCPAWKPKRSILKSIEANPSTTSDEFYIFWWSDNERSKLLAETTEIIVLRTGVTTYERNKAIQEDEFLTSVRDNDRNNRPTTAKYLRDSDLALLPLRVFAYALQDRKFVLLDCQKLLPVKESFNAFDSLKINPRHKVVVQGLVEAHFMKNATEKRDGVGRMTLDLIQGKGKGLFILLHGVPGVGKTATAEAVAQANGKPLFAITCGDLGLTPNEVETALRRIFRLAHAWDCVLLLDEVDTFFTQRSKGDSTLTKNAIVSVFLRVLEYYNGLLFLTTNRPGALDEAFKSRIHLKLYYPPLDFEQTRDVWQMNIERLRMIEEQRCADTDEQPLQIYEKEILDFGIKQFYGDNGKSRWNGRQIRNAFQIASSLAYFDARKKHLQLRERDPEAPVPRPKLDVEHFDMIHYITDDFDRYMQETVGNTDAALAFERDDRADHWATGRLSAENLAHHGYGSHPHAAGRSGPSWGQRYRAPSHGSAAPTGYAMGMGIDDGMADPTSRLQYSPNPSYGRPNLNAASPGIPSFSFSDSLHGPPGMADRDRDFGLQSAQIGHTPGSSYTNSRNMDFVPPEAGAGAHQSSESILRRYMRDD